MPRGCFDSWNAVRKSAIVVLETKNECVNVEGTMSCNAREEIGHLDLLEAGTSREGAGEAGYTEGTGQSRILDGIRETSSCEYTIEL